MNKRINWAGNVTFDTHTLHRPTTVEALQEIVSQSKRIKVIGARHSFTDIHDSDIALVTLDDLPTIFEIDAQKQTVTVNGAMRYGDLGKGLQQAGYALHNVASLPHVTIAGACATATHGSGNQHGALHTAVRAIEMVVADGSLLSLSQERDGDRFFGAVVTLGALGIVTKMTLAIEPSYTLRQLMYNQQSFDGVIDQFDDIMASAYSVSIFTDWPSGNQNETWLKEKITEQTEMEIPVERFSGRMVPVQPDPILTNNCTPGPWNERLHHFLYEHNPMRGYELQTEYFLHRSDARAGLRAVSQLHAQLNGVVRISEIRTIAADDYWMSPFYQRESVALHFTWHPKEPEVLALLPQIEALLAPFEPRPHWGKLFSFAPSVVQAQYERLSDFRMLARECDPAGKFHNRYLREILGF